MEISTRDSDGVFVNSRSDRETALSEASCAHGLSRPPVRYIELAGQRRSLLVLILHEFQH